MLGREVKQFVEERSEDYKDMNQTTLRGLRANQEIKNRNNQMYGLYEIPRYGKLKEDGTHHNTGGLIDAEEYGDSYIGEDGLEKQDYLIKMDAGYSEPGESSLKEFYRLTPTVIKITSKKGTPKDLLVQTINQLNTAHKNWYNTAVNSPLFLYKRKEFNMDDKPIGGTEKPIHLIGKIMKDIAEKDPRFKDVDLGSLGESPFTYETLGGYRKRGWKDMEPVGTDSEGNSIYPKYKTSPLYFAALDSFDVRLKELYTPDAKGKRLIDQPRGKYSRANDIRRNILHLFHEKRKQSEIVERDEYGQIITQDDDNDSLFGFGSIEPSSDVLKPSIYQESKQISKSEHEENLEKRHQNVLDAEAQSEEKRKNKEMEKEKEKEISNEKVKKLFGEAEVEKHSNKSSEQTKLQEESNLEFGLNKLEVIKALEDELGTSFTYQDLIDSGFGYSDPTLTSRSNIGFAKLDAQENTTGFGTDESISTPGMEGIASKQLERNKRIYPKDLDKVVNFRSNMFNMIVGEYGKRKKRINYFDKLQSMFPLGQIDRDDKFIRRLFKSATVNSNGILSTEMIKQIKDEGIANQELLDLMTESIYAAFESKQSFDKTLNDDELAWINTNVMRRTQNIKGRSKADRVFLPGKKLNSLVKQYDVLNNYVKKVSNEILNKVIGGKYDGIK